MLQFIKQLVVAIALSFYLFSIGFPFLPAGVNTKMMLAILGVIFLVFEWLNTKKITVSWEMLGATGFAIIFSLICYFTTDFNHTSDYSYANYFVTFFVWLGGAYAVCTIMRATHGTANLRLLTFYAAAVCFGQCIIALIIDRIPAFQKFVDSLIEQGQDFDRKIGRLYGIGASLDSAGIRFALILLLIAAVLSKDQQVRASRKTTVLLLIAFFTIAVVGDMIARTTGVGFGLAIVYFMLNIGFLQFVIKKEHFKFYAIFGGMLLLTVAASVYLYNTDVNFHSDMRFAFEGFFNWSEHGEFKTSSTDKLNDVMWIWPSDLKTWIIGTGRFGHFIFSTDIGYCRFILYCGLVGFSVFALFFVYNAIVFAIKYKMYRDLFLLLLIYSFIIWVKVSTDIFFLYALLYCMDMERYQKYHRRKLT
ncbi:hypothetical protein [Mucilaginibacter lappiensis]|uniref:O-Antigen ligase n=1 Tax=Mucilaginibacter lappiensis TaxID=354630 RepID=A0A841JSD5_9SPHI|nr:hypothetical protein [Mucilaginibacter lappiensis]MBB6130761.1 hypothetical protein [Mucilaginibacter lappiensis]